MEGGIKINFDLSGFESRLKRMMGIVEALGPRFDKEVYRLVERITKKLQKESIRRSPFDTGDLESSIKAEVFRADYAGNISGYVFVPYDAPAVEYAVSMHESFYNLRLRSIEKEHRAGVIIGRKYIERAFDDNYHEFMADIDITLKKAFW